jgi:hypothetical protein
MYFSIRLGALKLNWYDIPTKVRTRLENELRSSDPRDFNSSLLVQLLKGSELLEYRWKNSGETIFSAFRHAFSNVDEASTNDFTDCLYHFSMADMKWEDLSIETIDTIFETIDLRSYHFDSCNMRNLFHR